MVMQTTAGGVDQKTTTSTDPHLPLVEVREEELTLWERLLPPWLQVMLSSKVLVSIRLDSW